MAQDAIEAAAKALRRAVGCGQFDSVEPLLTRYAALVEAEARQMNARDSRLALLEAEARELLNWARETAIAERARAAEQLQSVLTAREYAPGATTDVHITETLG